MSGRYRCYGWIEDKCWLTIHPKHMLLWFSGQDFSDPSQAEERADTKHGTALSLGDTAKANSTEIAQKWDSLDLSQKRLVIKAFGKYTILPNGRGASRVQVEIPENQLTLLPQNPSNNKRFQEANTNCRA